MFRLKTGTLSVGIAILALLSSTSAHAADWYVATDGASGNSGAIDSPWDIVSALNGSHTIAPGDNLWIRGGTYKRVWPQFQGDEGNGFEIKLSGSAEAPIQVRPFAGERVTIDGGLDMVIPTSYVWLWDFEVIVSEPRQVVTPGTSVGRPFGGIRVLYGTGCKFINLVIRDNCMGFGFWTPSIETEIYGCLIYNNGYMGSDGVGNGPGIYTQNGEAGYKYITDNFIAGNYASYGFKAYSSKAYANNYLIEGNIVWEQKQFLVGAVGPSKNIFVRNNSLYDSTLEIGYKYYSGWNENCEVTNNVVGNNSLTITRFRSVVNQGNQVVPKYWPRPKTATVKFRKNKYDVNRAHLAIFNWPKKPTVVVNPGDFLKAGDSYRLMNPKDIHGAAVRTGIYNGTSISVPVTGEFAAYVVMK